MKTPRPGRRSPSASTVGADGKMKLLEPHRRRLLLSKDTSSANKMHLMAEWHSQRYFIEHEWLGIRHRVKFRFEPGGKWLTAKSILDDVVPKFEDPKRKEDV